MSSTPREIGTLIVVILKAKNLPNKRHIGKQDPFCSVSLNGERRRTKAIKRGGQHPEWDEEVRFTLYEDLAEERTARIANGNDSPPPPPPKNSKGPRKIKGGKDMKVHCFADDPREPDLIGATTVDLTEVLTKGETDEWFTLMNKEKYCGEVYLELTFWSNEPAPEKKVTQKTANSNRQYYGGPGSFLPSGESSVLVDGQYTARVASLSNLLEDQNRDLIPSSLRASNSLAKLDLYVPPYESHGQRNHVSPADRVASEFGGLGVSDLGRRESFPPVNDPYTPRASSSLGFSTLSTPPSHGYEQSAYSDGGSTYSYDRPITPTAPPQEAGPSPHRSSSSNGVQNFVTGSSYQAPYEMTRSPSQYASNQSRRPRYSVPTSSSGFMPVQAPTPTGFPSPSAYPPEPSSFSHSTPIHASTSVGYPLQLHAQSNYLPPAQSTPSASYHNPPYPPSQSFEYPSYPPPPSASAPPQHYASPPPPPPPLSHSAPPQSYQSYTPTPSPPQDPVPPPPPIQTGGQSQMYPGSRPLPQQPMGNGQQPQFLTYSPTHSGNILAIPPPPPPPQLRPHNSSPQSYPQVNLNPGPLPPPPPLVTSSQFSAKVPSRRVSLPQPQPYLSHQSYQTPAPPLPDLPLPPFPTSSSQSFYPGPPPRPPGQIDQQWPTYIQHPQNGYPQPAPQAGWN